jgi:hypothetical protein
MRSEEAKDFTVEDFRRHVAALKPEARMQNPRRTDQVPAGFLIPDRRDAARKPPLD